MLPSSLGVSLGKMPLCSQKAESYCSAVEAVVLLPLITRDIGEALSERHSKKRQKIEL